MLFYCAGESPVLSLTSALPITSPSPSPSPQSTQDSFERFTQFVNQRRKLADAQSSPMAQQHHHLCVPVMSQDLLPALRSNQQNTALTTTVYAPRQTRELELVPRYHRYAFQDVDVGAPERCGSATHANASFSTAEGTRSGNDVRGTWPIAAATPHHFAHSKRANATLGPGAAGEPGLKSVQLFRPRPGDQLRAVAAAQKATHRYRHHNRLPALRQRNADGIGAAGCEADSSSPAGATRDHDLLSCENPTQPAKGCRPPTATICPAGEEKSEAGGTARGIVFVADDAGSPLELKVDGGSCAQPLWLTPYEENAVEHIDAAMQRLHSNELMVPYFHQRALAARMGEAAPPHEEVGAALAAEPTLPADGEDPNARAVRKLFARLHNDAVDSDDSNSSSSSTLCGGQGTSDASPEAAEAAAGFPLSIHSAAQPSANVVLAGPWTLTRTLMANRMIPHLIRSTHDDAHDTRTTPLTPAGEGAAVGHDLSTRNRLEPEPTPQPSTSLMLEHGSRELVDCGEFAQALSLSPDAGRDAHFYTALRWLLYDEHYHRRMVESAADAESPIPWVLASTLDSAGGTGRFPSPAKCVLHDIEFAGDTEMVTAVDSAITAYLERLRAQRIHSVESDEEDEQARSASTTGRLADAGLSLLHQEQQETVLREAEAEKRAAFHVSLRYRAVFPQLLAVVAEEKRARLELLGRFASCTWPKPCRCLRWDAEILEDSGVPLSPSLHPLCVFVSIVLNQHDYLAEEYLSQRAAELDSLKQLQELEFMLLYVKERVAEDERHAFSHIASYHEYCMAIAARDGQQVAARFTETDQDVFLSKKQTMGEASPSSCATAADGTIALEGQEMRQRCQLHQLHTLPSKHDDNNSNSASGDVCGREASLVNGEGTAAAAPSSTLPRRSIPLLRGPRDSPFCPLLTFVELCIVAAAAVNGRAAIEAEEASTRASIQRRLVFLRAAAALEDDEAACRTRDVANAEIAEREAVSNAHDEALIAVKAEVAERNRRLALLARIQAEMKDLVALADREHPTDIEDCMQAFTEIHKKELQARRWAELRDRQRLEGTGAGATQRWVFERECTTVASREQRFRQKNFLAEVAERRLLHAVIQLARRAFHEREAICAEERRAFEAMRLTVFDEGMSRLLIQEAYVHQQRTLFGKPVSFDNGNATDAEDADRDDGVGEDVVAGGSETVLRESQREAHTSEDDDDDDESHATYRRPRWRGSCLEFQRFIDTSPSRALSVRLPEAGTDAENMWGESTTSNGTGSPRPSSRRESWPTRLSRRRSSRHRMSQTIEDLTPCHPLEGAVAMQRVAMYELYDFLPNHELIDLFSQ